MTYARVLVLVFLAVALVVALGAAPPDVLAQAGGEAAAAARLPGSPGSAGVPTMAATKPAASTPTAGSAGSAGTAVSLAVPAAGPAVPTGPTVGAAGAGDAEALARVYRQTGAAPKVEGPTGSLLPFGHLRPVLRCAPLRACAVELEAGELVLTTSLGDSERWLLQAAAAGAGARTPLLVVKPVACDLSTNLVVATDRRVYELALESPPCRNADSGEAGYNPKLQYTGLARFYYPDDLVRRWQAQEEAAREQAEREAEGHTALAPTARLAQLNFDYGWARGRWPWAPAEVFDDGEHTYVVFPAAASLADMPVLFALGAHDELAVLNSHLEGRTLVVDRVLERGALVVGGGASGRRGEQRLDIVNRAYPRRPAAGGGR